MKNNIVFYSFLLMFLIVLTAVASGSRNFYVNVDLAKFKYDESKTYLEIYYYGYYEKLLSDFEESVSLGLNIQIFDSASDSLLAQNKIKILFDNIDVQISQGKLGLIKTVLPFGDYKLKVEYNASVKKIMPDSIIYHFIVDPFSTGELLLSDLQLCKNIVINSPNKNSTFFKNTMEVIPNPTFTYGSQSPALYYYIELYNLQKYLDQKLIIQAVVSDKNNNFITQKKENRNIMSSTAAERGVIPVNNFEDGIYFLNFIVRDSDSTIISYKKRMFYIENFKNKNSMRYTADAQDSGNLDFFAMSLETLNEKFNQAKYIISKEDKKLFSRLNTAESKARFLHQFWEEKNSQNGPDYMNTYYSRVEFANEHFSASFKDGWKTEKGRVHIVHGEPDKIEAPPMDTNTTVEVWEYIELRGGVVFYFLDFSGFGDFVLVHSTHPDENQNPDWQNFMKR